MNRKIPTLVALIAFSWTPIAVFGQSDRPSDESAAVRGVAANGRRVPIGTGVRKDSQSTVATGTNSVPRAVTNHGSAKTNAPSRSSGATAKRSSVTQVSEAKKPTSPSRPRPIPLSREDASPKAQLSPRNRQGGVVQASSQVVYEDVDNGYAGQDAVEGEVVHESYDAGMESGCTSCGGGSCDGACGMPRSSCGFDLCNPGRSGRQFCICLPSHGWVQADYLMWYQTGLAIPPLLSSRTAANTTANETLVLGNQDLLTDQMNGGRIRFGWWFANRPKLGIEGEYLGFSQEQYSEIFRAPGGGPFLGRPFFNINRTSSTGTLLTSAADRQDIDSGSLTANAYSDFKGAAVRFRRLFCCGDTTGCSLVNCGPVPMQARIDGTLGWRYFQLNEGLSLDETNNIAANTGTGALARTLNINDNFRTRNQFNGVELGVLWQARRGYWSLDAMMRTSLGNNLQTVFINGSTSATQNGNTTSLGPSGFLALNGANTGVYQRNRFNVVPELGATLGYQLNPRWRLTAGYTFIYWSSVVRPGDQIDTDLNPALFPTALNPTTGANRPRFTFRESDYVIQGVNLGAEYRW